MLAALTNLMRYIRPFLILLLLTIASATLLVAIFARAKSDAKAHVFTHEQMLAVLVKNGIEEYFQFEVDQALFLADNKDVIATNTEGKFLLRQFFDSQRRNLRNITRVDSTGHISYSYPNKRVIGSFVGAQEHVKTVFRTKRPTLSSVFRTVQGYDAIALHVPVFKEKKFDGSIALVMPFEEIGSRYISSVSIGRNGTAVLFDDTGAILYSKNGKTRGKKVAPEELSFLEAVRSRYGPSNMKGVANVRPNHGTINGIGDETQIIAYVDSVTIQNITWYIKVALPESEAVTYVSGFNYKWTALIVSAIALFTIWGVVLTRAIIAAKREEELRISNERVLGAEKETQLARALLVNAVDQSPAGIVIAEAASGNILIINDSARNSGCIAPAQGGIALDILSADNWLIMKPDGSKYEAGAIPLRRSLEMGETVINEEVVVRSKADVEEWYSINSAPVLDRQGEIVAAITVIQNITEHKQGEERLRDTNAYLEQKVAERTAQMQESIAELEAFSYSVSHDLRAPLRHLAGYSHILLSDYGAKLDADAKGYLDGIIRSSENMSVLIDSLLHLSRISRTDVNRSHVNLSEIAQTIAKDLAESSAFIDHQVVADIQEGIEVEGDLSLLTVVMRNLLENAWKFTAKSDQPRVEVGCVRDSENVSIYVKDNGAGFNMDYVNKLFSAFQRLHSAAEYPGTGIGLTTVQRIVRKHGGRVWAEGKEGEGATFWFSLPC